MRGRLSRVLRITRWEAAEATNGIDRRTALVALFVVLLAGSVVGVGLAAGIGGIALDRDIYRVGVDPDSAYYEVVADDPALTPIAGDDADIGDDVDLVVSGTAETVSVRVVDSQKGEAARTAFREAVEDHIETRMRAESNGTAAFPVTVTLQYVSRTGGVTETTELGGTDGDGTDGDDGSETRGSSGDPDSSTDDGSDERQNDGDDRQDDRLAVPSIGGSGAFGGTVTGSPGSISPPFPFVSLVLAVVFLVPLNVVIQAYGSTILNERINRRGELLLVAPVTPTEIVAGKTLPYLFAAILATAAIALVVGGGIVSVLAVLPIAIVFLAATFVGAMFARSFKELTFVTVAISVFVTTYAFVPAIFTNVTPIALISPLTLVVFDLQGDAVSVGQYLFATGPFYLGSMLLFGLGVGIYREEDLFTQKPVPAKFLDALAVRLRPIEAPEVGRPVRDVRGRFRSLAVVAVITACTIPFVFVAELFAVAALFVLPVTVSIPILLVSIAFIEELAKSLHLYAGFATGVFERTDLVAVSVGVASGTGFFLAEKATAVVQAIGLTDLYVGRAVFTPVTDLSPGLAAALFVAPLVVHVFTTVVSSIGARRSREWYVLLVCVATLLHAAYNAGVVSLYA